MEHHVKIPEVLQYDEPVLEAFVTETRVAV